MERTVLVTGGTGALGRAVVKRFVDGGAAVHLPWIAENEVQELEKLVGSAFSRVVLHRSDVTSEAQVADLFRNVEGKGRPVQVLANIVGGFAYAAVEDTESAVWERMLRLNATSTFLCSRAAVPSMKAARWGRIVNVSSAPALNHGAANMSAYSAAKAAVLSFSESLAKELSPWRITVNTLVPSVIDTPANRSASPGADTSTWLKPEEIAEVVHFLAGETASAVNGAAINLFRG
ncbi:MAG: SDR family oxidoreductase [Gemmatimonadetes bacterium]|nr:SDR family oxidoreductase [Gemmatimonadota bacterium]